MNQLARHFWFTFSALSVKFPLHSNEVYSAPIRAYAELQKTILPALETDPGLQPTAVDLFPNYPVIPNRPALAEIVVVGSVSIILALLSGMVLWFFILKWTKEEKALAFGFRLLSKQIPFWNPAREGEEQSRHEEGSAWQRRMEKFKGFDFSALKPKRKKKKVSKEAKKEKKAKEVKEKQEKEEKPPEEMSEKQGEKEKPPEERKEKREKKTRAKRPEKQKKLRKIRKTKSTLQLKHPKGKKSPTRKKLK